MNNLSTLQHANQTVIHTSQESLIVLYTVYFISVAVHFLALFIHGGYVIPLQIKEAGVKNGLRTLRVSMLIAGMIMLGLNIVSIVVLTSRFFLPAGDTSRYLAV